MTIHEVSLGGGHLYDDAHLVKLEELIEVAERARDESSWSAVLLCQTQHSGIHSREWVHVLTESLLLDDLKRRILLLRKLIKLVKESRIPWIYATATNCFADYFELSMACSKAIGFNIHRVCGFPGLEYESFPPGGTYDPRKKKWQHFWEQRPIRPMSECVEHSYFEYVLQVDEWREAARTWVRERLLSTESSSQRPRGSSEKSYRIFSREAKDLDRLKRHYLRKHSEESPYKSCDEIMRDSRISESHQSELIATITARYMLSNRYLDWAWRDVTRGGYWNHSQAPKQISISVDSLIPPFEILIALMRQGYRFVLYADHSRDLIRGLEVFYTKIGRGLNSDEKHTLWNEQIWWGINPCLNGFVDLKAYANNTLALKVNESALTVRVSGFQSIEHSGMSEWFSSSDQDQEIVRICRDIIQSAGGSFVEVEPIGRVMYPSDFIKSILFQEIMKAAGESGQKLDQILNWLTVEGWEVLGAPNEWERFLSTRHATYGHSSQPYGLGPFQLEQTYWDIGNLKEATAVIKSHSPGRDGFTTGGELSQKLAYLAGKLTLSLIGHCPGRTDQEIDALCGLSAGFPPNLGSPLRFLKKTREIF